MTSLKELQLELKFCLEIDDRPVCVIIA